MECNIFGRVDWESLIKEREELFMLKRVISSFAICFMLVTSVMCANASEELTVLNQNASLNNMAPYYEAHCGNYATHDMLSRGHGTLYDTSAGKTVFALGAAFQCTRCYLVCVTQGEPPSQAIGYWATYQPNEQISSNGAVIYTSDYSHTNAKTLAGMTFRYYQ